jgi:hypothetical protein
LGEALLEGAMVAQHLLLDKTRLQILEVAVVAQETTLLLVEVAMVLLALSSFVTPQRNHPLLPQQETLR